MIRIRRDAQIIPAKLLQKAEELTAKLETLAAEQRTEFINKKAAWWRAFGQYLSQMSHLKCWYSESPDPQSFFDVDHFRPKSEAKRSETESDAGYPWLAFDWTNFRVSAQKSNRLNANPETQNIDGKGSWFPLMPGSPRATWNNRCVAKEQPILLDPTDRNDVDLIDVAADGRMGASLVCVGLAKVRVERSIEIYGLNLPGLVAARKRAMREVHKLYDTLQRELAVIKNFPRTADQLSLPDRIPELRALTAPQSPYARAARAQAYMLGLGRFVVQEEDR